LGSLFELGDVHVIGHVTGRATSYGNRAPQPLPQEVEGYYRERVENRVIIAHTAYILNLAVLILLPLYY
jgi:hypothetical protein